MGEPTTTADVDLTGNIYPEFPAGWNSATDLMEAFLLVGALELKLRRDLNPWGDPFDPGVLNRLPPEFKFDPFGALVRNGEVSDAQMRERVVSANPSLNHLHHGWKLHAGEVIGRYPLIGLVWRFVDEIVDANESLRAGDRGFNHQLVMQKLGGLVLGKHGLVLFMAVLERRWFEDGPARDALRDVEVQYLGGHEIPGHGGMGRLAAAGHMYEDAIWKTTWRLIERRSPEYYIERCAHRREDVEDVLRRGALLAQRGARNCWPGWRN
ncbi:hypothetical protein [Nocardioides sp. HB32]